MDEILKRDHEVINSAWRFLKKHAKAAEPEWEAVMTQEFLDLYREYDGANNDFAHKMLDTVLWEVQRIHTT